MGPPGARPDLFARGGSAKEVGPAGCRMPPFQIRSGMAGGVSESKMRPLGCLGEKGHPSQPTAYSPYLLTNIYVCMLLPRLLACSLATCKPFRQHCASVGSDGWEDLNAALQSEEARSSIAAAGLSSAMLASSLRRLPANEHDATVLAEALRSPALPTALSAATGPSTDLPLLAAMIAAAADPTLEGTLMERARLIGERRQETRTLYPIPSDWVAPAEAPRQPSESAAVYCKGEPAIDPSRAAAARDGDSEWANAG